MKQKVAEYIADFFVSHNMTDCFMITGGGAMHLNDAIGHHPGIKCVFNHHEQACAIAAEGYFRASGKMAPVCVTSGPGGTNAITGVMGAWVDSIPMLVVSGQVKRETTVGSQPGLVLRQLGDQEFNIVETVSTMTKYAVMVDDENDIAYHLEKAYYLALEGRMGPVWLDIPLDIQAAIIDTEEIAHYSEASEPGPAITPSQIKTVVEKILSSKAPAFLVGSGVRLSGSDDLVLAAMDKYRIPTLVAWNSNDLVPYDNPYFAGMPGTVGTRAGNFVLQNADLVISLGCRMNIRMIGYEHFDFAKNAEIIAVDIDPNELKKSTLNISMRIQGDVKDFLEALLGAEYTPDVKIREQHDRWLSWAKERLVLYPAVDPKFLSTSVEEVPGQGSYNRLNNLCDKQDDRCKNSINPYLLIDKLFEHLNADDCIVCANGSACVVTFQAAKIKSGQRMFTNSGCATMGYGLPAAIGAAQGSPNRRIIAIEGDGSIMMNLQELATIAHNNWDIHILILNNSGYHSMRQTQKNLFDSNFVGIDSETGLSFPDFELIAKSFGIRYTDSLEDFLSKRGPVIYQAMIDKAQDFEPKISSQILEDGRIVSATLDDMYPLTFK